KKGLILGESLHSQKSLSFVKQQQKHFIHHMEAHALMVRMLQPGVFPFLSWLWPKESATFFYWVKHWMTLTFLFKPPMGAEYDCNLSFALLQNQVTMSIQKKRGRCGAGDFVVCVNDIAAATQWPLTLPSAHIVPFCSVRPSAFLQSNPGIFLQTLKSVFLKYTIKALKMVTDATELHLLCPPSKLCKTEFISGMELRLKEGKGILSNTDNTFFSPFMIKRLIYCTSYWSAQSDLQTPTGH
uniref:Uncharacterized protein n=1 Tax=Salmo trutta TaxID=8032 RepID=A0A674BXC5_SALTR